MGLVFLLFINSAFERYSSSTHALALGNAFTASAYGTDAIRFNPAALCYQNKNELLCGYEHFFSNLEGLRNINIGFARPLWGGGFGVQLSEFGFSEQKEQTVTIAFGTALTNEFSFGLGGDLYLIDNQRIGYGFAYGLDISFLARLYRKWSLGIFGHNLNRPQFGDYEEGELPYEVRAGFAYVPFEGVLSELDVSMVEENLRVHMAGEFSLFKFLNLRVGVKTNPSVVSTGTGIVYKFIGVDYGLEYIPELPLTHSISLEFEF